MGSGMQDGVNLGTVVRVPPQGALAFDGVEPLDTLSDRRFRSKGAHAVEFSKTVAPLEEGCPPESGAPETLKRIPGRTDEYSARNPLSTWYFG